MHYSPCIRRDGGVDDIPVYDIYDFPYYKLDQKFIGCRSPSKKGKYYAKTYATFDIETTTVEDIKLVKNGKEMYKSFQPYGFMYIWQMCVGGYCVTGRYWSEWEEFLQKLRDTLDLNDNRVLCIYVHNLSYEFQFMQHFLRRAFGDINVFATEKRKVLRVETTGIEFRCSYRLSNMSLQKFTLNEIGCIHIKAVNDLDYRVFRLPTTILTPTEEGYCISDVLGLYEAIGSIMSHEHDNQETIPMTSTGYVRKEGRRNCKKTKGYHEFMTKLVITEDCYRLLKEEGRGGDTHTNRHMSGRVWYDVDSFDAVSSYPYQLMVRYYPITSFTPYGAVESMDEFDELINKYCCLFRVLVKNVEVRDRVCMPYVPVAKCNFISKDRLIDNGRVVKCDYMQLTMNEIDWELFKRQYTFDEDDVYISDLHFAKCGDIPKPIKDLIMEYFRRKSELKIQIKKLEKKIREGTATFTDKEVLENANYLYAKSKNKLNAIFGMMYTDPVHDVYKVDATGEWLEPEKIDIATALEKNRKSRNTFLYYAWGSYCTSWARMHLADLVAATGPDTIYCDTDSSKAIHVEDDSINMMNEKIMKLCEEKGAYCDVEGTRFYMGIYEKENHEPIKRFKALGAKKYAYEDENGFHITIAGVNKKLGAKEMGSIDNFKLGFTFKEAGGSTLYYNDKSEIESITLHGCTFETSSNVGMVDSTYTLGITDEYANLLGLYGLVI